MAETLFWVLAPLLWAGTAVFWCVIFKDISTGKADPIIGGIVMTMTGNVALFGTLGAASAIWGT